MKTYATVLLLTLALQAFGQPVPTVLIDSSGQVVKKSNASKPDAGPQQDWHQSMHPEIVVLASYWQCNNIMSPAANTAMAQATNLVSQLSRGGIPQLGEMTSPSDLRRVHTYAWNKNLVSSGSPSWLGNFPGTGAFSNQYGSVLMAYVAVISTQQQDVSLAQLRRVQTSSDLGNCLGFSDSLAGRDYTPAAIGVRFGIGGITDTSNWQIITGGAGTQACNMVIYAGGGAALSAESQADSLMISNLIAGWGNFSLLTEFSVMSPDGGTLWSRGSARVGVNPPSAQSIGVRRSKNSTVLVVPTTETYAVLQRAPSIKGPWTDLKMVITGEQVEQSTAGVGFYRLYHH